MVGQISLFPYDFAPRDWTDCDGRLLPIFQNQKLFNLIGFTFGGDHQSSFAVPDLTAIAPKNWRYCLSLIDTSDPNRYAGVVGETFALPTKSQDASNLVACEGQSFTYSDYPTLAMYMGDRFGGDGGNYKLPDLKGKPLATDYRYVICMEGNDPMMEGARDPLLGQLLLMPYDEARRDLLRCDGQLRSVMQNQSLYDLIGNTFGGNRQQFGLPDVRSATPTDYNYFICANGEYPVRP